MQKKCKLCLGKTKKIKINQLRDNTLTKNMQNLPIKFPNKKGLLELTPPPLKGRVQKKVWNFPYFSGMGGFEKVIFLKKVKRTWSKMPQIA